MTEKRIIEIAKEFNIHELVINKNISNSQTIKFENKVFTETKGSEAIGFSIKAFIDGNKINKYIARPTDDDIRKIFEEIIEENKFKTKELDEHPMDTSNYKYANPTKKPFNPLTISETKKILKQLVEKANATDKRILKNNTSAIYGLGNSTKTFVSTSGTNLSSSPSNNFIISLIVYFDDGKEAKGVSYVRCLYTDKKEIKLDDFIKELKNDIKLQEKKKAIKPGNYEVVFEKNIFMDLFNNFLMHINGRTVIDGISKWKNQLGKQVASKKLNLIDNPIEKSVGFYVTYDKDAFPTKKQHFIKDGVLQKFLTNKKLADLLKTENSGNSNGTGASFINVYIEPGNNTFKEIISSVKRGVFAVGFSGMHSGINPISGEFSIELKGNIIEDGKIKEDIKSAVISGNFFKDVLPNIEMVGNKRDVKMMTTSPVIKLSKKLPISS